jgi:hypothetical protein
MAYQYKKTLWLAEWSDYNSYGETQRLASLQSNDLWRCRLHVELKVLATLDQQLKRVDARLDALGEADLRVKRLTAVPGVGTVVVHLVRLVATMRRPASPGWGRRAGTTGKLVDATSGAWVRWDTLHLP